jgi:hypothetical protein
MMEFPGCEEAIKVLAGAEIELSRLGYRVEFTKSYYEKSWPELSGYFSLSLTAEKWAYPDASLPAKGPEHA